MALSKSYKHLSGHLWRLVSVWKQGPLLDLLNPVEWATCVVLFCIDSQLRLQWQCLCPPAISVVRAHSNGWRNVKWFPIPQLWESNLSTARFADLTTQPCLETRDQRSDRSPQDFHYNLATRQDLLAFTSSCHHMKRRYFWTMIKWCRRGFGSLQCWGVIYK